LQAFVSDIHGNLEALNAVLADIKSRKVDEIFCLGDVVGYGPAPRECLEIAFGFAGCIRGNHEEALLTTAEDFNVQARRALEWTRDQMNLRDHPREKNRLLWNFIDTLSDHLYQDGFLLVHGSPRDRVHEYIVPEDVHDPIKMAALFALVDRPLCFNGHSHLPGVYLETPRFIPSVDLEGGFALPEGKRAIVNVGSVGQPRDGDPRACYTTLDGGIVRFHRVHYNIERTSELIVGTGRLPLFLAARLKEGK
jgi:diadenosine tetraphosphatase ApaH/serine/threonine PP2A family protein phosphatase